MDLEGGSEAAAIHHSVVTDGHPGALWVLAWLVLHSVPSLHYRTMASDQ